MASKNIKINGGYPLHTFEQLEDQYKIYISSEEDRQLIRKAYDFILEKHKDQYRKSGEPYYHHLLEVAYILADLHAGPGTIIAGLLHDVVEDTETSIDDIKEIWGKDVAKIVDSLTKIQRLKLSKMNREEFEAEDHRKIFIGMAKDIRVILIKLADRLHNLRTLDSLSEERQVALSKETEDVFIPIATRLGLETIRSEMANICLSYLHPEEYKYITSLLSKKTKTLSKSLEAIKKRIADILFKNNIEFEISSRVKSISSIYDKMYKKGHQFDEIYDILALRIICNTEIECYQILGLIHSTYTPVPGRFKDYIATPKINMYQSLHTTIISGDGNFYEIQIRTKEMDNIAETGVASHWAYKEGSGYNPKEEQKEIENKLHWFRDFVSVSKTNEKEDASEYIDALTKDIFEANVYIFTPKGKVIELPTGSTPLDFAYRIHSRIGESTTGAIVNGVLVPLNTILNTGDVVEIKTSKNAPGPNEGWLDFVRTNTAKTYIRRYLSRKNAELLKEEKISKGYQSCLDAFSDRDVNEEQMMKMLSEPALLANFGVENTDDLFIAVSGRKPTANALIEYLKIKKPVQVEQMLKTHVSAQHDCPVSANGVEGIAFSLANCCTPIPGDEIVGYITKGKGISIHRKECPNIANEKDRLVDVQWIDSDDHSRTYPVDIVAEANDRPNLLVQIMTTLTNSHISVTNVHCHTNEMHKVVCHMTILVDSVKRLNDVINILLNVAGIYDVKRVIH